MRMKRSHKETNPAALMERLGKMGVPLFVASSVSAIAGVGLPMRITACSTKGVRSYSFVKKYSDIAPAIAKASRSGLVFSFERMCVGHEVVCGVLVLDKKPVALVPVDALPRSGHDPLPHHLSPAQIARVQELAVRAHKAVGAGTHSCVRCVVAEGGAYVVSLEVAPRVDSMSAFFMSASLAGFRGGELSEEIGLPRASSNGVV